MDEKNFNLPTPPADLPLAAPPSQSPSSPVANVPADLPMEPEDILESIEGESETPTPRVSTPAPSTSFPPARAQSTIQPQAARPFSDASSNSIAKEPILGKGRRALVLGLVVVVLLGVLGVSAWYGYSTFFGGSSVVPTQSLGNQTGEIPSVTPDNTGSPSQGTVTPQTNPTPVQEKPTDTDRDGLSDTDEELYGTNPEAVDTDNDGLTDRDEVKVFKTDPSNPDTDGDGFADGEEVRAGYDPKGPGRLLEIEGSI